MKTWLYHPTEPPRIFDLAQQDYGELRRKGWRDTPADCDATVKETPKPKAPAGKKPSQRKQV